MVQLFKLFKLLIIYKKPIHFTNKWVYFEKDVHRLWKKHKRKLLNPTFNPQYNLN